ncbi:hypothetical protein TRFO_31996 [Tritrichomonas foetus]|uniref:Uncharacterized protein n=1 Tax=Tritrichomonas foetus TaxID=1144522 RepID=A0A1J4JS40_9EUKA|nr:hypothetical protein TRFO_31996 [Tritrichomonas foetus]|eukprot:OHT01248.1 hypothetical protein TRFO_31996 [Tritrichomonas foetus]
MQAINNRKRNYVKRKRSLNESMKIILSTLQAINANSINPIDSSEITHRALSHAKAIEAACWSRRAKFSDDVFQSIVRTKTMELCRTLINSAPGTASHGIDPNTFLKAAIAEHSPLHLFVNEQPSKIIPNCPADTTTIRSLVEPPRMVEAPIPVSIVHNSAIDNRHDSISNPNPVTYHTLNNYNFQKPPQKLILPPIMTLLSS